MSKTFTKIFRDEFSFPSNLYFLKHYQESLKVGSVIAV